MKPFRPILLLMFLTVPLLAYEYNDSHIHLTNFIQEGTSPQDFLKIMGDRVGRSVLFGLPLQQQWSYRVSGKEAPTYYLDSDSHLYYYSFTDAAIAMAYKSLTPQQQSRFDPMIIGFNPTDMYAADHIRRVLKTFPGVFEGIGEFSIHKEFVSSKITGDVASLTDPALDRILDLAAESGLVVLIHNDIDRPIAKKGAAPLFLAQMKDLLHRHPKATIIWAHAGMGRIVHPITNHAAMVESLIEDPALKNLYFDLSWDEVAKYLVASPESIRVSAELINKYPDRFLFGSDEVAPTVPGAYFKVYDLYAPLREKLTPEAREKLFLRNYIRIFDEGRRRVRAWEAAQK
jgi:predicted TIM-barrel fold metal-dependent hydrolase